MRGAPWLWVCRSPIPTSPSRWVLLNGPCGPVQMPRITETEFRMRTQVPRGLAFYADYRREESKMEEPLASE